MPWNSSACDIRSRFDMLDHGKRKFAGFSGNQSENPGHHGEQFFGPGDFFSGFPVFPRAPWFPGRAGPGPAGEYLQEFLMTGNLKVTIERAVAD